jgi:Eukaryotic initiation factor 4E
MRESIYLFKQGFQPVWEDRRNINGGSWTFRVPKVNGPDFWTRVQLMAIGEKLQGCLDVGKSYRVVEKAVTNTDKELR